MKFFCTISGNWLKSADFLAQGEIFFTQRSLEFLGIKSSGKLMWCSCLSQINGFSWIASLLEIAEHEAFCLIIRVILMNEPTARQSDCVAFTILFFQISSISTIAFCVILKFLPRILRETKKFTRHYAARIYRFPFIGNFLPMSQNEVPLLHIYMCVSENERTFMSRLRFRRFRIDKPKLFHHQKPVIMNTTTDKTLVSQGLWIFNDK